MRLKDIAEKTTDLLHIDPRKLTVMEGLNVRSHYGEDVEDQELVDSIVAVGVKEPLLIFSRDDKPIVSNGHRRLWAVNEAIKRGCDIKTVPCRPAERGYNEQEATFDLFTRNSGKPLTTLEQAKAIGKLINYGFADADIANRISRSQAYVSNAKLLLNLPAKVTKVIETNNIAATLVMDLARQYEGNAEKLEAEVNKIIEIAQQNGKKKATKKDVRKLAAKNGDADETKTVKVPYFKLNKLLKNCVEALDKDPEMVKAVIKFMDQHLS